MKIGIIYGSSTGNTQLAAEKIAGKFEQAELKDVAEISSFEEYDVLILGSSTWGLGDLQDDWEGAIHQLEASSLVGKKVALFGLGDQVGYPDTFVDAMGKLGAAVQKTGAELIGKWPAEGYECLTSEALEDDYFNGLPLDVENQDCLSDQRITSWCDVLKSELAG